MKKTILFVIMCTAFSVFSVGNASALLLFTESGSDLADNRWTDREKYVFKGGVSLDPGYYELTFTLHAWIPRESDNWEDNKDKFFIEAYLNDIKMEEEISTQTIPLDAGGGEGRISL